MIAGKMAVKIEDIDSLEKLIVFLKDQPIELAKIVASRNALRALPVVQSLYSSEYEYRNLLIQFILRYNFISWSVQNRQRRINIDINFNRNGIADPFFLSTNADEVIHKMKLDQVTYHTRVAMTAAVLSVNSNPSVIFRSFSSANSAFNLFSKNTVDLYWSEILYDLNTFIHTGEITITMGAPLWHEGAPVEIQKNWSAFRNILLAQDPNWQVWTDWYEHVLHGATSPKRGIAALSDETLIELAQKPNEFWEREPDVVNAEIADWVDEEHKPSLPPMREFILQILRKAKRPVTIDEFVIAFEKANYDSPRSLIIDRLHELTETDKIVRVAEATYALTELVADGDFDLNPTIPNQEIGLSFAPNANGKIEIKSSGIIEADDFNEIIAMREIILEALDDLKNACAGTNAYAPLVGVVQKYFDEISLDAENLSIDKLYAYGIRLENTRESLKQEIASGDYPEMAVSIAESLDSVVALHGPTILSTKRGNELVERARKYNSSLRSDEAYKEKALELAKLFAENLQLIERKSSELVTEINADIGEGANPERSTELATIANGNLLSTSAKIAGGAVLGNSFSGSAMGVDIIANGSALFDVVYFFMLENQVLLREFGIVAGQEMKWLGAFLDWLEKQKKK